MILMTDKAVADFTQANNFSLNANAGLTIINYSAQGQAPVGKGDVILWSKQGGAFAGVHISGANINQNKAADQAYYGKEMDATWIMEGKSDNAKAEKLKSQLPT